MAFTEPVITPPVVAPPVTAPIPPPPVPTPVLPDSLPTQIDQETYDRLDRDVRKVRERAATYVDPFQVLSQADREALLGAVPTYGSKFAEMGKTVSEMDAADAASLLDDAQFIMQARVAAGSSDPAIAAEGRALLVDITKALTEQAPAPTADADKPLTRAEYDRLRSDEAKAAVKAASDGQIRASMVAEMGKLGYNPDSGDPLERGLAEGLAVTADAIAKTEGPDGALTKAAALFEQLGAAGVEAYLARKTADAARPVVGSGAGAPASSETPPTNFRDSATSWFREANR